MFSLKNEEKYVRKTLLIVESVFIIISLFSIFKYGNSLLLGSLQKFDNDDVKYIRSAWNLLDNKIISYENIKEPTVYIMPGLTFILSFFMMIFGKFGGITAFKVFQVMLQAASIYLIFLIGRKVFSSRVAITACIIDALYGVELFVSNMVLTEVVFKFLLLFLIYISIYAVEKKKLGYYVVGGIVWAFACLLRPTIAVYPVVILIMWIKNKYKISEIFKYTAVVLGVFCLIMMPWWVRNYKDFSKVILFTKSSGNPFLQGTFINYDQSAGWGVPYVKGKNPLENDQNEINAGFQRLRIYVKKEPIKYFFWYTVGKIFYFWKDPFYWRSIFNIPEKSVVVFHITILILGITEMAKEVRKKVNSFFLFGTAIFLNIAYLPFYTFGRYSYPCMPLVIIFAGAALNKSLEKYSRKEAY